MLEDPGYALFQKTVQRLIGVDLTSYRQGQMKRRLDALVTRVGAKGFGEYAKLLARRTPLKVWSAACSIGAEPYSVATLLKEQAPTLPHKIIATDVDITIVDRARRADKYVQAELKNIPQARLDKAFIKAADGAYTVKPDVRQLVDVKIHNLLTAPPAQGFDLILCRNVVIYFMDDAKATLCDHLVGALRPGGILFVGGAEMVASAHQLGLNSIGSSFYRKEEVPALGTRPRPRLAVAAH